MKKSLSKQNLCILLLILITIGVLGRLLPHVPNATPITALAIVGSLYFGRKTALLLPLGVLLLTDLLVGFYSIGIMASVYGSFALIALGSTWLQKRPGICTVCITLIGASLTFFLITNAAVWWFSPWYEKSFTGLLYAYELGLPFLRNMFVGDVAYTYTLLGAFALWPYLARLGQRLSVTQLPVVTRNSQNNLR